MLSISKMFYLNSFFIAFFLFSCAVNNSSLVSDSGPKNPNTFLTTEKTASNLSLADRLKRIPGLRVMDTGQEIKVMVRGASTAFQNTDPLYVINHVPIGHSYNQVVSQVDPNDIKAITVLKDAASSSLYGIRGSNGVILISTKK